MQQDRAMRLRNKKDHSNALRAITVIVAIISAIALLSTVQTIPQQSCQADTFDGHHGTYNICTPN